MVNHESCALGFGDAEITTVLDHYQDVLQSAEVSVDHVLTEWTSLIKTIIYAEK